MTNWEVYQKLLPKELSARGSDFNQTTGQALSFHHGRHGRQSVAFDQPAGDPCWGSTFPRRNNDAEPVVSASSHGATAGVHHKTDLEAKNQNGRLDGALRYRRQIHKLRQVSFFP